MLGNIYKISEFLIVFGHFHVRALYIFAARKKKNLVGMVGEYTENKDIFSFGPTVKGWLSPNVLQFLFLLLGTSVTLAAFLTLKVFLHDVSRDSNRNVMKITGEFFKGNLSDIERLIKNVSTIISLSEKESPGAVALEIKQSGFDFGVFQQVFWVYQSSPEKWQFSRLYEDKQSFGPNDYQLKVDRRFLTDLISGGFFSDENLRMVSNFPGMQIAQKEGPVSSIFRPIALVKVVRKGDLGSGILIALTSSVKVFDLSFLSEGNRISMLNVYDLEDGRDIYRLSRKLTAPLEFTQSYKVEFAGHNWEIKGDFMSDESAIFLAFFPYVFLSFGVFVTAAGTLYLRIHYKQSFRILEMNNALELKNTELKGEIEKRNHLNKALGKAERENRAIIDSVSDIIFETDGDGKILFLSATWQKVTGFDIEQSKGLELFQMIYPGDQKQQKKNFQRLVGGHGEAYRTFTRLRTSNGNFRAVELAVSMTRLDEDDALRVVGTFTDMEERRRAERALAEAEKKYRTIVEHAAGGIYQLTPEGLYLSVNPAMARILGYDGPEEILMAIKNANIDVYGNARDRENFVKKLESGGSISNNETQVLRKDGSKIWVNENVRVVRDDHGGVLYYEGSLEDITARKGADLALREAKIHSDLANRAKSEFLANMSHELRTPLNAIIGFSEMIKNEVFGPVEQKAYWEYSRDINESGVKLLNVINEILDISRIEAGERQLNEGIVDFPNVLESCLDLLGGKIDAKNLHVTNTLQNVPGIIGEEIAIKQIVVNLLSNAVKFTESGGRITISSEMDAEGRVQISFTDTGIGLDEKEIEKALSPFGQGDNALGRSGSGTGLGLTLVDALLKLHGGELELFSQKGIGTTVTIIFPADRVDTKRPSSKTEVEEEPSVFKDADV